MIKLAHDLVLPVSAVTETIGILARKDGGKTYTGLKLFEEMHAAGAQCVAIDPVGKWWALRLAADGKSPGIDVPVFGGQYGDLPLEPTAGALIARVIVERGISAVVDVSLFEDRDMKRFVTDFARELYKLKQRDQSVLHVFIEEASSFCPQDKEDGSDPPMLAAMKKIVRKGRNYGIGVTLIDQRAQDVNKKVLNQTSILIVLGTSGTTDRSAIEKWVRDKHIDVSGLDELASLAQGEAFVWLPRAKTFERVHIAARWTFDASATPKLGAKRTVRKLTPTDVSTLRDAIAESVKRVEAEDPKALRKRIAELERLVHGTPAIKVEEIVEKPILLDEDLKLLERAIEKLHTHQEKLDSVRDRLAQAQQTVVSCLGNVQTALGKAALSGVAGTRPGFITNTNTRIIAERAAARSHRGFATGGGTRACVPATPPNGEQVDAAVPRSLLRILDAIRWYEMFGIQHPTRQAVAIKLGLRVTGTFETYLSRLKTRGFIAYPTLGTLALTDEGHAHAQDPGNPSAGDLRQIALEAVPESLRRILRILIDEYPGAITRERLAEKLEIKVTGTFETYLSRLKTFGVLEYPMRGAVMAARVLFP